MVRFLELRNNAEKNEGERRNIIKKKHVIDLTTNNKDVITK